MFGISRWQVFKPNTGDVVICKKCEMMKIFIGGEAPDKLPRLCPVCRSFMIGKRCWFPPKE